jgi:phosphatidylglycerophosphate synthase
MPTTFGQDLRTAPNLITLSRIALILAATPIMLLWSPGLGMFMAIIAGLTDYADGMVARRTGQVTRLGEILLREFWIVCIRRYMAGIGENIPSTIIGKLKSNFINWGFLPAFFSMSGWLPMLEPYLNYLGHVGAPLGLAASYISGVSYTRVFLRAYNSRAATTHPQKVGSG